MNATLMNLAAPGTLGGLRDSRLRVGTRLYKVRATDDALLVIRRGGYWEYYRSTGRQFEYTMTGSTRTLDRST